MNDREEGGRRANKTIKLNPSFDDLVQNPNKALNNGLDNPEVIIDHVRELTKPAIPTPHENLLAQLLDKIEPVDFRVLAELEGDEKLGNNHYQIITVEQILNLAKANKWGMAQNHDFIYIFNGAYWGLLDTRELKVFLGKAAERLSVSKYKARHWGFRDSLYKQFIALANLPKPEHPNNVVLINLNNGTFEITPQGTRLRGFDRNDFLTYQLPFDYDPKAKAPLFQKYIDRVLPDIERQNIIAEFLGCVFTHTSTLKLEKALLLYGTGANGKSVFYDIVRKLLGEQNTSEYSLNSLTNDSGYYRAMIANKLVNYASEINGKLEASVFKQLVSGEPVEARLPYGNPFIITNYAKLIFNCNELPREVEQTRAFFRRFLIVPFDVTISEKEQDKQLASKIIDGELSGIFNWMLKGLDRLLKQKRFSNCKAAESALEQYEKESDSVRLFLEDEGYQPSPTSSETVKSIYQDYRTFCGDDGYKPVNRTNFIKRLEKAQIVVERKNIGKVAFVAKSGWLV